MANVLDQKVQSDGISLIDGLFIAGAKVTTEAMLERVPFIGNGTMRSGLMKIAGAVAISMLTKNKYARYAATGMLIDGGEDIVLAVRRGDFSLVGAQSSSNEVTM